MKQVTFLILALLIPAAHSVELTEVMYDPIGSDNNKEFIEITGRANLTGWVIADAKSNDTLTVLQENVSSNYSLIVEEGFDFSQLNCNIYSAGATIGNNLNNGGDTIILYDKNYTLLLNVTFDDTFGKNNDHTRELQNNTWKQSTKTGGTPCMPPTSPIHSNLTQNVTLNDTSEEKRTENNTENNNENRTTTLAYDIAIKTTLDPLLFEHVPYLNPFRVENKAYRSGHSSAVTVTFTYTLSKENETLTEEQVTVIFKSYKTAGTGRIQLNESGNYTLCAHIIATNVSDENLSNNEQCTTLTVVDPFVIPCNISLGLDVKNEQLLYTAGEKISFKNRLIRDATYKEIPYEITYTVERLDGSTIRETKTANENLKSFTPKTKEKIELLLLKNRLSFVACNNSNNDTTNEQLLVILGEAETQVNESLLEILEMQALDRNKINHVPVKIYKGDTGKYSISLWAEDEVGRRISEKSTFRAKKKMTSYELSLPLLFTAYETGTVSLILEGLGERTTKKITVNGKKEKQSEEKQAPILQSFYTRTKKPGEKIKLYATMKGEGNVTVTLTSLTNVTQENITLTDTYAYKKEVTLLPGPNLFILELGNQYKILSIKREPDNKEEKTEQKKETRKAEEKTVGESLLTGMTLYQEVKSTRALPVLLGTIGLLLLGLLLQQKA
jgi:hypothetical protein